jgi:TnpA family transposase
MDEAIRREIQEGLNVVENWNRHINFQGRYNFRQISQVPDIDELVEKLKLYPISLIESLD